MKQGTQYAKKLKAAYSRFRGMAARSPDAEPTDPIDQLIVAVLSQDVSTHRARKALKQLGEDMVDLNELRVSTPAEVSESIGKHIPRNVQRSKELLRLLNAVYQREYAVSLDSLRGKGVRDMKGYLDSLDGATPYIVASVLLWSLGGHAIPVNDTTLAFLKKHELVNPGADGAEVQAFLERHISAADAKTFCLDLEAYASSRGADPPAGKAAGPLRRSARKTSTPRAVAAKGRAAAGKTHRTAPRRKARNSKR